MSDTSTPAQSPDGGCHCGQCFMTHGHIAAYTLARQADLGLAEDDGLTWYGSSERARRWFCRICGSSLFWELHAARKIAIGAGSLDQPSGLTPAAEIFTAGAADYYELAPGLKHYPRDLES